MGFARATRPQFAGVNGLFKYNPENKALLSPKGCTKYHRVWSITLRIIIIEPWISLFGPAVECGSGGGFLHLDAVCALFVNLTDTTVHSLSKTVRVYLAVMTTGMSVVVSGPAACSSESLPALSLSSESLSAAPGVAVASSLLWLSSSSDSWLVLVLSSSLAVLALSSSSSSGVLELSLSLVVASLVLVLSSSGREAWRRSWS